VKKKKKKKLENPAAKKAGFLGRDRVQIYYVPFFENEKGFLKNGLLSPTTYT
jgi:hypothetical protein